MIERDTIVVGGGPGGAATAWELHRRGHECLVLDREAFPRENLCYVLASLVCGKAPRPIPIAS